MSAGARQLSWLVILVGLIALAVMGIQDYGHVIVRHDIRTLTEDGR